MPTVLYTVSGKKGPTVLWTHNFDKLKYIVDICCNKYRKRNSKTTNTTKVRLT